MGDAAFPRVPEDITTTWLSDAVGAPVTSFDTEQIGIGVGLLGRLFRLSIQGDGAPASVIAKFPTLDESARMNVVEPLRFYEKEVRFYEQMAGDNPLRSPTVYSSGFDPATGDFVLLLEDLSGRRMCDQTIGCEISDAEVAIDAMAGMHAEWWQSPRFDEFSWLPAAVDAPLPQVVAAIFKQGWPQALEVFGDRISDKYREYGERFPDLVEPIFEVLARPPITFLHGDFRLDNLFFGGDGSEAALTAVDWQICIKGRGGYDLGYFLSQSLTTEARHGHEKELVDRYRQALADRDVSYPLDDLWDDYRRTVAFCFAYPVSAAGQIEITNERHRELITGMLDRAISAIDDTDALEVLP